MTVEERRATGAQYAKMAGGRISPRRAAELFDNIARGGAATYTLCPVGARLGLDSEKAASSGTLPIFIGFLTAQLSRM